MTPLSAYFTVFATFLLLTACGAKSSGGSAASTAPAALAQPQALVAAASQSSVATGATTTFSVIGGTGPYTWTITSGGGTLSSSTGSSVIHTASNSAGMVYLSVRDSLGSSATASVNVVGGGTVNPTAGKICSGNYAVTLGTYAATATLQTSGTTLSGVLNYAGYPFALTGTCTAGGVSFTLTETGDTFNGTFAANAGGSPRAAIAGTYTNVYYGSTQNWTATPQ